MLTMAVQQNLHSPLLSLHTELRLEILNYLLPDTDLIQCRASEQQRVHPSSNLQPCESSLSEHEHLTYVATRKDMESSHTNIMRTSRQIYTECYDMMYQTRNPQLEVTMDGFHLSLFTVSDSYNSLGIVSRLQELTGKVNRIVTNIPMHSEDKLQA